MNDKTRASIRGRSRELSETTKTMRRELTPAEDRLWNALRNSQLNGLKFRRQHALGRFILDFYCPAVRLAIEVDGGVHDDQAAQVTHLITGEARAARQGEQRRALAHRGDRHPATVQRQLIDHRADASGRPRSAARLRRAARPKNQSCSPLARGA